MVTELLNQLTAQPLLVVLVMTGGAVADSALGVGALLPGETMVAVGASVLEGTRSLWLAWVSVAAGAFVGDHVGYAVGRRLGPAVAGSGPVRKVGRARWERVTALVRRHAVPTLALGRLAPGVRTLVALSAGAAGVSYARFALGSGLGALLWSTVWVGGGAGIGRALQEFEPVQLLPLAGALVALALVVSNRRRLLRAVEGVRVDTWLTWPNAVTLARLVLTVPLCLWLVNAGSASTAPAPGWLVVVGAVWAGSDWLDGALARRLGQQTRVGEVLDPVADRLGVLAVCLSLVLGGHLPWWPVLLIVLTDAVVLLLAGHAAAHGRLAVSTLGKVRTAVLLGGLCLLLAGVLLFPAAQSAGVWAVSAGAALHVCAGIDYVRRALSSAPALGAPAPTAARTTGAPAPTAARTTGAPAPTEARTSSDGDRSSSREDQSSFSHG